MSDAPDTSLQHVILPPGVKRGRPGTPPRSQKGRVVHAAALGPWDMLKAMRRVQLGEPLRQVARSYGISHTTLQRWQTQWGGDVAHVRWGLDIEHVQKAEGAFARLQRRLARQLPLLKMRTSPESVRALLMALHTSVKEDLALAREHLKHIDGDSPYYWRAKREAAAHIPPSKSQWRRVPKRDKAQGTLGAEAVRTSSYWDAPSRS